MKCYECSLAPRNGACSPKHIRVTVKGYITLQPLEKRRDEKITCSCGCGVIGCETEVKTP